MKNSILKYWVAAIAAAAFNMPAWAEDYVVIVNKGNSNVVDKAFVAKVFTGEAKNWPDGGPIFSIDQAENTAVRAEFYSGLLGKSSSNMKALWAQNIFSGKGLPPKVVDPDPEVKKVVSSNKNAIGYIKASSVDDTIKVIAK